MTVWGDWVLSVFNFVSTILKILQYFQCSTVVLSAVYSSTFGSVLQYFQGSTGMTKESLFFNS